MCNSFYIKAEIKNRPATNSDPKCNDSKFLKVKVKMKIFHWWPAGGSRGPTNTLVFLIQSFLRFNISVFFFLLMTPQWKKNHFFVYCLQWVIKNNLSFSWEDRQRDVMIVSTVLTLCMLLTTSNAIVFFVEDISKPMHPTKFPFFCIYRDNLGLLNKTNMKGQDFGNCSYWWI